MIIYPHRGIDQIAFGASRSEVAQSLGEPSERGSRSVREPPDCVYFRSLGAFVYYDEADRLTAIEFISPAIICYDGYELFAHSALDVLAWAKKRDDGLLVRDGFRSILLGLSMYAPFVGETDLDDAERADVAQSFLAFSRGYYDDTNPRSTP